MASDSKPTPRTQKNPMQSMKSYDSTDASTFPTARARKAVYGNLKPLKQEI